MCLFGIFLPLLFRHWPSPVWPWILGAVLWIWALLIPTSLQPVYLVWMKLGQVLNWINTRLILGVVFFLLILPMGLLRRFFGSDTMRRKSDPHQTTFRVPSTPQPKTSMEKPY